MATRIPPLIQLSDPRVAAQLVMSICAFHFYIIYFHFFSADHGIPQTFDYILTGLEGLVVFGLCPFP